MINTGNRKLPIGIQDFEYIRKHDYLYIDKTEYIYNLVHSGKPYFLSRPRRFGKSLLLSTMKAYWEGRKDLFHGLRIEALEADTQEEWRTHPVFYFSFDGKNYQNIVAIEDILDSQLKGWEAIYGGNADNSLEERFKQLLKTASEKTGEHCVVLVDEYDKSLLDTIEDNKLVEHNKAVFKGFFSVLKSQDAYIRFVFITGVSKFSKVSIFSDLNQLEDISFDDDYAGICGITEEEMTGTFVPEIRRMAQERSLSEDECIDRLKAQYDGYHFSANGEGVYNPYSLLSALKKRRFGNFWFETGTPTFLVRRLRELEFDVRQFGDKTVQSTESILSDYRVDNPDPVPLLYQTGYLTIAEYSDDDIYTLGFPNEEVRYAFLQSLMPEYVNEYGAGSGKDIFALKQYLENGDLDGIKNVITALFASITYTTKDTVFEHYFQTVLYIVIELLGKYASCERHTYTGRIDLTVETEKFVYLFEFKRDLSADDALRQIKENHYADPYAADSRKLYQIGVNFDSVTRQMNDWKVME